MLVIHIAAVAAIVGTLLSLVLIFDARADHRAAQHDRMLSKMTRHRLLSESFRFLAQASFLAATLVARFRVPGTLQQTIRWLLVAVPVLLAVGSLLSWQSKRRLLRDTEDS